MTVHGADFADLKAGKRCALDLLSFAVVVHEWGESGRGEEVGKNWFFS